MSRTGASASTALFLLLSSALAGPDGAKNSVAADFDRDVLPILAGKCLGCHSGPNPKAHLDLLSRASALRGGSSGEAAVIPGDAGASRLLAVVDGTDAELRMPPRGDALTAKDIEVLRGWIAGGAEWSKTAEALSGKPWHWSYRAPLAAQPPVVADAAWSAHPIDRFVQAALEREHLPHAPQAPRTTLARRLSLTLTGLVPAPETVEAFVADQKPGAVERYVDTLLASPHYGERMARLWLDLARYADTNGYEKDERRSMWPWRDWVIDAFNRDMPYDRFALEQLAGDLLEQPTRATRVATGFHRNTMVNEEGGVDPEEFRVEALHDRVATTASVFLGATLACARCHDHKFDPFSLEDYYSFFAFFDNDLPDVKVISQSEQREGGARLAVPPPAEETRFTRLSARREELAKVIATPTPALDAAQASWETARRGTASAWKPLVPAVASTESGATLVCEAAPADGATIVARGTAADVDTYRLEFALPAEGLRALRLEVLPEAGQRVGRAEGGNFVLGELAATWISADKKRGGPVAWKRASADHEQRKDGETWLAAHAIDGNPKTGWAVGGATDVAHELVLETAETIGAGGGATLRLTLAQRYGAKHTLARFRISATATEDRSLVAALSAELAGILRKPAAQRTDEEARKLAAHYRGLAPALAKEQAALDETEAELARIATGTTLVMQANPTPRVTHVLRKGNFLDPGPEVAPEVPAVFGKLPDGLPRTRLGLARWIASRENPLFARVFVNHVWELDFGRGLVPTSDDFGTQGDAP
ncbi:MAG TPA: DUF1549 domain-containing protein, partial [Planctomycetota bacterium]|nr:DUF1549 domain-containing protein [Planctomycetota bacterium]